jgi:hypothetical protein
MAKDATDYSTVDFIPPVLHVTRGQVLMDRQRHIAIVAKKGKTSAHLVHVRSGVLKMTRHTAGEIVEEWSEAARYHRCGARCAGRVGQGWTGAQTARIVRLNLSVPRKCCLLQVWPIPYCRQCMSFGGRFASQASR